jgi:hypothetical protein
MSDDLVKRLTKPMVPYDPEVDAQDFWEDLCGEAKDHIEALTAQLAEDADVRTQIDHRLEELVAQVESLTAERDRQYDENVHRIFMQAKAETERDKWREAYGQACTHWLDQVRYEISKTEAAEVDKARLRTALEDIADGMGEMSHAEIGRYAPAIARAALNTGKEDK